MPSSLALLLVVAAAAPVVAIDHQAPYLEDALSLEARVVSSTGRKVFEPAAFVRRVQTTDYQRLPMQPLPDGRFAATLPPPLQRCEIEYFLEAFDEDGNGPFRRGSPERPLRLPHAPAPIPGEPLLVQTDSRPQRTAGIVLVAGGAAALVGGGVAGVLALQDFETEKKATTRGGYEQAKQDTKTKSLVADVLYGVGGVAAAVGVILLLTDRAPATSVSLSPVPGGAVATVTGRF